MPSTSMKRAAKKSASRENDTNGLTVGTASAGVYKNCHVVVNDCRAHADIPSVPLSQAGKFVPTFKIKKTRGCGSKRQLRSTEKQNLAILENLPSESSGSVGINPCILSTGKSANSKSVDVKTEMMLPSPRQVEASSILDVFPYVSADTACGQQACTVFGPSTTLQPAFDCQQITAEVPPDNEMLETSNVVPVNVDACVYSETRRNEANQYTFHNQQSNFASSAVGVVNENNIETEEDNYHDELDTREYGNSRPKTTATMMSERSDVHQPNSSCLSGMCEEVAVKLTDFSSPSVKSRDDHASVPPESSSTSCSYTDGHPANIQEQQTNALFEEFCEVTDSQLCQIDASTKLIIPAGVSTVKRRSQFERRQREGSRIISGLLSDVIEIKSSLIRFRQRIALNRNNC